MLLAPGESPVLSSSDAFRLPAAQLCHQHDSRRIRACHVYPMSHETDLDEFTVQLTKVGKSHGLQALSSGSQEDLQHGIEIKTDLPVKPKKYR